MTFRLALFLTLSVSLLAQSPPPIAYAEMEKWMLQAEADRPFEEIVRDMKARKVLFRATSEVDEGLKRAASKSGRPEDGIRQMLDAVGANWIYDSIRQLARDQEGIAALKAMVVDRNLELPYDKRLEQELRKNGALEPALMLIWPPAPPDPPRLQNQEWRSVPSTMVQSPSFYNPLVTHGTVDLNLTVDGKVLLLIKHSTIFYQIVCGRDLEVKEAKFSSPIPWLDGDGIDYSVDFPGKKPRGKVYACPADPRCQAGNPDKKVKNRLCTWEDLNVEIDGRGFANTRLLVDDDPSGAASYEVRLKWAVKPFSKDSALKTLKILGAARMRDRVYARGAGFQLDAASEAEFRDAGADDRLIVEMKRNVRGSNMNLAK